ncbi:hypothetical protein [Sinomicrobium sp. M5D2P9]
MKTTIILAGFILMSMIPSYGQNKVFAFFEYDIRADKKEAFVNGYARDLEWQKTQGDDWSWVGWFILNGDRRGRFVDATPNHTWNDFDNWKVDGAENSRLNQIHWLPYVENPSGSYKEIMDSYSNYNPDWYKSKYLQVYYIYTPGVSGEKMSQYLTRMTPWLNEKLAGRPFVWMKTVSGGNPGIYILFVGLDKIEDLKLCDAIFQGEVSANQLKGYESVAGNIESELWMYDSGLSLFPDPEK